VALIGVLIPGMVEDAGRQCHACGDRQIEHA
jgi:hypothetical protein